MMNIEDHLVGFEEHMKGLLRLKSSTRANYRAFVKEFILWHAEEAQDDPGAKITRPDIERYLLRCKSRGNGNVTLATKLSALKALFRYLAFAKIIEEDPTADILLPEPTNDPVHSFTREEIFRLFWQCDLSKEIGLRNAAFIILGAFCGLRTHEICMLNVDHLEDAGTHIDFNVIETQKGRNRTVRLWETPSIFIRRLLTLRLVQGAQRGDPLLTSYKKDGQSRGNRRLTNGALDKLIKKLAANANIQSAVVTTHALRATHIESLRHIQFYDVPEIAARMGWRSIRHVEPYLIRRVKILQKDTTHQEYWQDFIYSVH